MKIGFIGTGNMGKSIMKGMIAARVVNAEDIYGFDVFEPALLSVKDEYGITTTSTEKEVVENADAIIIAVKPQFFSDVMTQIKEIVTEEKLIISIASGVTIEQMNQSLPRARIARVMPNTHALVGEGMSGVALGDKVNDADNELLERIFSSFGKMTFVPEKMMDIITSVSGASPAFVYIFIEALADGAVQQGMPRNMAYTFAAQAVLGSAKVVMETDFHPGGLKDMVCSPGGASIEGIRALEEGGFRGTVMNAVIAAAEKGRSL